MPILSISNDIDKISSILRELLSQDCIDTNSKLKLMNSILSKDVYETKSFKKIFNKYADNIYYSDPREANLYLGGGTTPTSKQTTQYLLRNDLLSSIDNIKSDGKKYTGFPAKFSIPPL